MEGGIVAMRGETRGRDAAQLSVPSLSPLPSGSRTWRASGSHLDSRPDLPTSIRVTME